MKDIEILLVLILWLFKVLDKVAHQLLLKLRSRIAGALKYHYWEENIPSVRERLIVPRDSRIFVVKYILTKVKHLFQVLEFILPPKLKINFAWILVYIPLAERNNMAVSIL